MIIFFALFDPFEKFVNEFMSILILITNLHVLRHNIFKVDPIMYVNFIF